MDTQTQHSDKPDFDKVWFMFQESIKESNKRFERLEKEAESLRKEEAEAVKYALKKGFLVIKATGNSSSIINSEDFKPKAW